MTTPCPYSLLDGQEDSMCDLPFNHEGQHVCYVDDGNSIDRASPFDDMEGYAETAYKKVRYSVRWPEEEES